MPPTPAGMRDIDLAGIDGLRDELGASTRVITDPDLLQSYRRDQVTIIPVGTPRAAVLARSVEDVAATLRWAHERGVVVIPRGAGTGLAGGAGAIDDCLVLSTAAMTTIRQIDAANRIARVEAGVITADVDKAARAHGLMYPPDPGSYEISTIGGNLATNAGGLRCVKYGVTRDSVLGLEVVLADGRVVHTGGQTPKNVAGYDLTSLFVGSEGTLGVITSATLKLRPAPPVDPVTVVAGFPSLPAAGEAVAAVIAAGLRPSLLELMDRATLRSISEMTGMELGDPVAMLIAQADEVDAEDVAARIAAAFTAAGAEDVAVSEDPKESAELVSIRRLANAATERMGSYFVEDVGVPTSRLPEMIATIEEIGARHHVTIMTVAHAGDGNLHPCFVFERGATDPPPEVWAAADEVFHAAIAYGGTLTGEHGVGVLKQRWLADQLGPVATDINQAIKHALDPKEILSPGRGI